MPSRSSTDQAYATAPTSLSTGGKGSVLSGTASRVGGGEGGLGGRQATALASASSPTSPTLLEDRSPSPSPFDSSAAGRKRKKVYYGKKDESDLSELSQAEEESSGEESEGWSGTEEGDGEGDDEDGSDDLSDDEMACSRTARDSAGSSTILWPADATRALERGLPLVPSLGKRSVKVGGKRLGRNGMLAEYIRRQTGLVYSRIQVNGRLRTLELRAKGNKSRLQVIKGVDPDKRAIAGRDWSSHLGPDLHPPSKKRSKHASASQKKKSKRIKQELKTPSSSAFPILTTPALPSSPTYPPPPSTYYQPYSDAPNHHQLPPTYYAPNRPALPPKPTQSFPLPPRSSAPPRHAPSQATPPTPLKSRDLSAFLSSFSPSQELTSASCALLSAGLSSAEDLASLLAFEDWTLEAFLQQAFSGLDKGERETVKAMLERARRGFARV